ncbi:ankyrin-1 [Quercus suber]|uniref:Ankyrin-1 n=1 Tax=Quercus suber TaxID=58331 RepID=A0AAW0KQ74_QUESU
MEEEDLDGGGKGLFLQLGFWVERTTLAWNLNIISLQQKVKLRCPSLLRQNNVKGETPLHIAARYGHAPIVEVLIERAKSLQEDLESEVKVPIESALQPELESGVDKAVKKMLKMKNKENETAMHEAVRNNHLEVVKLLVENGKDISYSANDAGETPLYMAVERNYREVVFHILENCKSLTHDCPLGGTTLHAAVKFRKKIEPKALSALINQKYNQRLTPLHCAAYFNGYSTIKILLKIDRSMAYKKDTKDMTALHIAADRGHVKIVNEILKYCPDCSELVDKRGWNALHFAVNSSHKDVVNVILNRSSLSNLLNEKDESGNTPLLHSKSLPYIKDLMPSKTHLVVDTLIATVVFTAGITMPGGFIGHEGPHSGSPVLIRNTAFKAFIITNTIAMVQSCSAAFIHLFMPLLFDEQNVGEFSFLLASLAFCLSISAMGAMVLAFVMGTYAVLMHSLDLAIANSVIGLLFFIPVFFVSIGCLKYLLEILRVGSSWILDKLYDFKDFLGDALDCILDGCFNLYERIVDIFNR